MRSWRDCLKCSYARVSSSMTVAESTATETSPSTPSSAATWPAGWPSISSEGGSGVGGGGGAGAAGSAAAAVGAAAEVDETTLETAARRSADLRRSRAHEAAAW